MLYDLAVGPPRAGSLLESIFLLISKRRQEQQFLETRVLIEASLAPHLEKNNIKDTFDDYFNSLFPYLAKEKEKKEVLAKEALKAWTANRAFRIKPLWRAKEGARGIRSKLVRGVEAVKAKEAATKSGKLRRLDARPTRHRGRHRTG